jgi:hypothetical protein
LYSRRQVSITARACPKLVNQLRILVRFAWLDQSQRDGSQQG